MAKTGQSHCPVSRQTKGTLRHTYGQDTIYRFPICRLSHSKKPSFTTTKAVFYKPKHGLL